MGMANGRMMEFALLAGDRYGYPENHTDKWETKSSSTTAAQGWIWRYENGKARNRRNAVYDGCEPKGGYVVSEESVSEK